MPRIKKPKHMFSDELLKRILAREDEPLHLLSVGNFTVGDTFNGYTILGFVRLRDSVEEIQVVIDAMGRYGRKGFVQRAGRL